jgi:hypothetical protein
MVVSLLSDTGVCGVAVGGPSPLAAFKPLDALLDRRSPGVTLVS